MVRPFSLPWQQNGSAPAGQGLAEVAHAGVALLAGLRAGRSPPWRPARARRSSTATSASGGTKTCRAREAARASTAAASAALPQLAMARGACPSDAAAALPGRLDHRQVQQQAHQVARLVRAGHVARSRPSPTPRRPSRSPSAGAGPKGVMAKAVAVDRAMASSRRCTRLDEVGIAPAPRARRMPGVQRLALAHEGVGVVVAVEHGVVGQAVLQHVVAIVPGRGCAQRKG